ncbi:MAG: TetR/AcrR family transcriptional regulator [Candidatus Limnocylindrales bacterium]
MIEDYQNAPSRNSTASSTPAPAPAAMSAGHRGRPRSDKVHRAILDAARELLIKDGYTRLRLEHVAALAGVGKATIYRRWGSKEQLAQALLADLAAPHIAIEETGDTREEMLAAVMNPMLAVTESEFGPVIRALLSQIATNPALGDPFRATVVQARRDEIARMIARGIERGDLCPDADAEIATELLVGPVYFRLMFGGELDREFAERIVDNVMRGYTASGNEAAG